MKFGPYLREGTRGTWEREGDHIIVTVEGREGAMRYRLYECAVTDGEPVCKYGDPTCPCQDGDMCHYEGENSMTPPNEETGP